MPVREADLNKYRVPLECKRVFHECTVASPRLRGAVYTKWFDEWMASTSDTRQRHMLGLATCTVLKPKIGSCLTVM